MSEELDFRLRFERAIFRDSRLPAPARLVALALKSRADDDGRSWPSVSRIMSETSLGRRTVFEHLHGLLVDGWLARESGENLESGRRTRRGISTTCYLLRIPPRCTKCGLCHVLMHGAGGAPGAPRALWGCATRTLGVRQAHSDGAGGAPKEVKEEEPEEGVKEEDGPTAVAVSASIDRSLRTAKADRE